jgi:hypothetical protein
MTTTTGSNGRLGNQIIRNLAVSLLAEKFNLKVDYFNKDLINELGIELFNGENIYQDTIILDDYNYFYIYDHDNLNYNLYPNKDYFQTKEITNFLYDYLHTDKIKSNIINKNSFKDRYNANNDLFIHIRLADVSHHNPGIDYYMNTISTINFDNLYISTDEKTHDIIETLITRHPNAILIDCNEIVTIQFASTCKNIILSHGSFSAIIGYLSFFSKIYYPEYETDKMWYGDMFSINNWIKCSVKQFIL